MIRFASEKFEVTSSFEFKNFFKYFIIFFKIVWIFTFLSVILLNVDVGLIIGISVSLITIVIKDRFLRMKQVSLDNQLTENDLTKLKDYDSKNCKMFKIESMKPKMVEIG